MESKNYKENEEKVALEILKEENEEDDVFNSEEYYDQIDYILAWEENENENENEIITPEIILSNEKRHIFLNNLQLVGLNIIELNGYENIHFIGIQAPTHVVKTYAEILKLRKPMKKLDELPKEAKLTAVYSRDKEYLFDDTSEPNFFTKKERVKIIDFILSRNKYTENINKDKDSTSYGLRRLLNDGIYTGAYPPHDEITKLKLNNEWANLKQSFNLQDLDVVKEYFGVKIGLYFAWLGFYTHMLIPASIVGLICFFYGLFTVANDQHSSDVCNSTITELMCPLCDNLCDYWDIKETCFYTRLTYLFDNNSTVLFAFLMSIWSAIFIECWKRYSAEISHRWDLTGFDIHQEQPRPEYYERLKNNNKNNNNTTGPKIITNRITQNEEPTVQLWQQKIPFTTFSFSAVIFLISLAIAAVLGIIVYRGSVAVAMSGLAKDNPGVYSWSLIVVNHTAAIINLIIISIFNWLYSLLAHQLTELEIHRTQTSFDNSLTFKMYLLQFVNCYSSITYVAFFKGKFVGTPHKYNLAFGFRQEECGPGGCMTELCIQLATIMIGNQIINAVQEMCLPYLIKKFKGMKLHKFCKEGISNPFKHEDFKKIPWAGDYYLLDWDQHSLFDEYLEMVLQYGFLTIFVVAFPLGPFFALLNNILELRWDAKKFLNNYKRPIAQRVKDIGTWYTILNSVSNFAVVTNAFIIAMTSNFIPKLVYRIEFGSLSGFLEHSLAYFNTTDPNYKNNTSPLQSIYGNTEDVKVCRYPSYLDFQYLSSDKKYERINFYWKIWIYRLIFIILYQNIVTIFVVILKWLIPDIPTKLNDQIKRENYWTLESIIRYEAQQVTANTTQLRPQGSIRRYNRSTFKHNRHHSQP